MKTILVSVLHNNQAMGFLANDAFEILAADPGVRLVIACPSEKLNFYLKHYQRPNVIFDTTVYREPDKIDRYFEYLLYSLVNTKAVHYRQKYVRYQQRNYLNYLAKRFLCLVPGRIPFIRKMIRKLDNLMVHNKEFDGLFEKYKPDLAVVLDILHPRSVRVLRSARKFKVFTIGFVRSWDNLTSKGAVRVIPDKVIVQNDIMKQEGKKYADIKPENVFISGVQVFDIYADYKPTLKDEFYKKVGATPGKKLILFAPYFGYYSESVSEIISIMDDGIKNGDLPADLQFLVRFPPVRPGENLKRLDSPNIVYYTPGTSFYLEKKLEFEFTREDIRILADSMHYCPVTINFASTMTIDAAAFDAPVINIAFDGYQKKHFKKSVRSIYNYDHYQPVLNSGGIRLAYSKEQLFNQIKLYLERPETDREGRKKIIEIFCGKIDGKGGERIADFIKKNLKNYEN